MQNIDFSHITVLVIGDVMLDTYFYGKVDRISQEAPVPIVNILDTKHTPGGAANVSNNIACLGATAYLIGTIGNDENGRQLAQILKQSNIKANLIPTKLPTITKIRVVGEHQQIVRLDFEEIKDPPHYTIEQIKQAIDELIPKVKIMIISDYAKGFCHPEVCEYAIMKSRKHKIKVVVDPKGFNWEKYQGASFITPNVKELQDVLKTDFSNKDSEIERYGKEASLNYLVDHLLITRSKKGMSYIYNGKVVHIPTDAKEVYDVSGAGDTVVATLAVALASQMDIIEAIKLANRAAGIVVNKFGTAPITIEELRDDSFKEKEDKKIIDFKQLSSITEALLLKKNRIVFKIINFTLLDKETILDLRNAKEQGDILFVFLSNQNKNEKQLLDHSFILSSLEFVDYVCVVNAQEIEQINHTTDENGILKIQLNKELK